MKNSIIITIVLALIVGVAAFFGGMKYQQSKVMSRIGQGQFRQRTAGATNLTPVRGQIITSDDKSVTVKLQDGSSKIVLLPDTLSITEATAASKIDLQVGKQVMVLGSSNSDGSVTAQNIQLNPQSRGGG